MDVLDAGCRVGSLALDVIVSEGWASREELDAMLAALREWGERPDAFASWLYCGALGWAAD